MEIILSFAAGLILAAVISLFVSRSIIKSRVSRSETEHEVEKVRLETELAHVNQLLADTKADLGNRYQDDLSARDKAHEAEMASLQSKFDLTIAKVTSDLKSETAEMLKAREKEFSESSGVRIGQIVTPLMENIAELKKTMADGSKEQAERSGEMKQQIEDLMKHSDAARKSADELAAAFKHSGKVQGDWGEAVLEELLSSQGLTNGIHFHTQAAITSELRPDVILHLDSRREVIIDSKVSLTAYMNYVNAENEEERTRYLKEHIDSVKKHWKELARKDYSSHIQPPKVSMGYVIMFVPVTGAFWAALNAEPGLWREAANNNVYITDEMSLYSVLKMVNLTWTQITQVQNHKKVYELADELVERIGMFMEQYNAIGKALDSATESYNKGKDKLTPGGQSILTTTQKLIDLGARNDGKHKIKELLDVSEIPALPEETAAE